MYQMRIAILMLLLLLPAYSQGAQYSEGACLLLQQQMERFANQKQSFNYRNARYEYEKNCSAKAAAKPRPAITSATDVSPAPTSQAANTATQGAPSEQAAKPSPEQSPEQSAAQSSPQSIAEVAKQDTAQGAADAANAATPATAIAKEDTAGQTTEKPAATPEPLPAASSTTADTTAANAASHAKSVQHSMSVVETVTESPLLVILESLVLNLPLISASMMALLMFVFLLTSWLGLNLPGFKGVFAEYKLNRLLRWRLKQPYYHFRKLHLYNAKDERVLIDHLVLSPYGIFVISVQNYRGQIAGAETQANWTRLYFGHKKQFMNPLHQNFKNTEAVRHYLQIKPAGMEQLFSVVAFSRLVTFGNEMPAHLCYIDKVSDYIRQFNEPCFDAEQLTRFQALLQQARKEH